jgi:hypothetical protein
LDALTRYAEIPGDVALTPACSHRRQHYVLATRRVAAENPQGDHSGPGYGPNIFENAQAESH